MDSLSDQRLLYELNIQLVFLEVRWTIMENWSIKPGKVVNLGHQAHVPMDSWGISKESFDQTI